MSIGSFDAKEPDSCSLPEAVDRCFESSSDDEGAIEKVSSDREDEEPLQTEIKATEASAGMCPSVTILGTYRDVTLVFDKLWW